MGVISYLRAVYDVATLDTRFTTPSSAPYRSATDVRDDPALVKDHGAAVRASATPSKWKTLEYKFYFVVLVWAIPNMFRIGYSVSNRTGRPSLFLSRRVVCRWQLTAFFLASDPRYTKYAYALSPGWMFGRKIVRTTSPM